MAVLLEALDAARAGEPGAVVVQGDAGVGKTRLLSELAERARASGARVLVGHCSDLGESGLPYLPFTEALAAVAGDGDPGVEWRAGAGGGDLGQLQVFESVAATLATVAGPPDGPVVLVVEDLHWSDRSTRDLLSFLLRRLRDERLLVVASYRGDDLHRRHPLRTFLAELVRLPVVRRVDLSPFTADEMAAYLSELSGREVPDATVRRIHERSEGNAYFAAELFECGAGAADAPDALPTRLADVVLTRLEGLSGDAVDVVRRAAVGGRRVRHEVLRAVAGVADEVLEAALREAVAAHLLVPDGADGYAFRHALLYEAVYADLLPGERTRWHAAYAHALTEAAGRGAPLAPAAQLAHHRQESHDLPGALVAALLAADEADGLQAPAEAWHQLEHALSWWDVVPDAEQRTGTTVVGLLLRTAHAASRAGMLPRARSLAEEAVDRIPGLALPDPDRATALALRKLAEHRFSADAPESEALAAALRSVELAAATGDGDTEAWASALAARALLVLHREDEARGHAERARGLAADRGVAGAEADALITLAALDLAAGRGGHVDDALARAEARAREAGHPATALRAAHGRAAARYDAGDPAAALEVIEPALAWCAARGLMWSPYGLELRSLEVTAHYTRGDWARALRAAGPAGSRPPDAMAARLAAHALQVQAAQGDPAAMATAASLGTAWDHDPYTVLTVAAAIAEQQRWSGDAEAAVATIRRALAFIDERAQSWFLIGIRLAAVGLGALGDVAERPGGPGALGDDPLSRVADTLVGRARSTAEQGDGRARHGALGPEGRAWLARAEAEHARTRPPGAEAAVALWQRAADGFGGFSEYERARCRGHLAAALLAAGRRDLAAAELDGARRVAADLGARPLTTALDALGRRAGVGRGSRPAGPLTPREAEVLALVAHGLTNRRIGERLFMAEKTVSVHVSRIIAKLGVSGRTEAVAVAHREGLLADRVPSGRV
jgi:DNA-binding CsgD family transcriptional regulator/tetratricopeptide (TPR) repeat protein